MQHTCSPLYQQRPKGPVIQLILSTVDMPITADVSFAKAMLTALGGVLVALSTDPDYTLGQMLETLLQKPP